jgi:hypothetical protein
VVRGEGEGQPGAHAADPHACRQDVGRPLRPAIGADLLAEVAALFEGTSEGELDEPLVRQAAQLCRDAGPTSRRSRRGSMNGGGGTRTPAARRSARPGGG